MQLYILQQVEDEGQNDESECDPFGPLGKLCIQSLCLGLEGVAVIAAADSAAEAGALAGLEHDDGDESNTGNELNDGEYDFNDFHLMFHPFNVKWAKPILVDSHG